MLCLPLARLLLALTLAAPAAGEPEHAPEPVPEPVGLRPIGVVASLDTRAGPGRGPGDELSRVSTYAPGSSLRSMGGLGRFSAVSPRWSGTPLFVDGAPLQVGLLGPVDHPLLLTDGASRVDVYRSHVPGHYGAAPIGEAIDVVGQVHRAAPHLWFAGGLGSALTRDAHAGFAMLVRPHLSIAARVDYGGSQGSYPHFDDAGTPLSFGDDGVRRRASNNLDTALAQLRLDHERGDLRLSSQLIGRWRLQGVPGPSGARPSDVSLASFSLRSISSVRRAIVGPGGYIEWIASLSGDGRRFRDPNATLGPASDDERALSLSAWVSPRLRLPAWFQAWVTISAELGGEWVDIRERASELDPTQLSTGDAQRHRLTAGLGLELEQWLFMRRWSIAPMLHVDVAANNFDAPVGEGEANDEGYDTTVIGFTPRLGTRFVLIDGLDLRGSVGRYMRLPSLFELFGDRGFARGNEGLGVESGTRVDGGLVLELDDIAGRPISVFAQALGYVTWSQDLIQWTREGPAARAVNIERARLRGIELATSVRAWHGDAGLDLSYRFVDSANGSEGYTARSEPVPGQPRHTLRLRPTGGHRFAPGGRRGLSLEPRLHYELDWISGNMLDLAGFQALPARSLHAVGVSLRIADRVELGLEAQNLANVRSAIVNDAGAWPGPYPVAMSDLMGFPLAGRSLWASVRIDASLGERKHARP